MINISSIVPTAISRLKKLPMGHYLEFMTFKKDRSIKIIKIRGEHILIIENGYEQKSFEIELGKLKKILKTLIKKEFPRSKKAHLYSGEHLDVMIDPFNYTRRV